jgi:hypothetical protein
MFRAAYRSSSGALTVFAASGLHMHVVTGRSQVRLGTGLGIVPVIIDQVVHTTMHGSMNIKSTEWRLVFSLNLHSKSHLFQLSILYEICPQKFSNTIFYCQ